MAATRSPSSTEQRREIGCHRDDDVDVPRTRWLPEPIRPFAVVGAVREYGREPSDFLGYRIAPFNPVDIRIPLRLCDITNIT